MGSFLYNHIDGVIAQLVARLNGIQKVRGSTPLSSTKKRREGATCALFFCASDVCMEAFVAAERLQWCVAWKMFLGKSKNGTASAVLFSWRKKFGACLDARREAPCFMGMNSRGLLSRGKEKLAVNLFHALRRFKTIMTNCKQICNTSRKKEDIMNTENRDMRKNLVMPLSKTMLHAAA